MLRNSNNWSLIDFAFNLNSNYNNYYFAEQTSVLFIASAHLSQQAHVHIYLSRMGINERVSEIEMGKERERERAKWMDALIFQDFIYWIVCRSSDCIPNTNIWGKLPNKPLTKPLLIAIDAQRLHCSLCVEQASPSRENQTKANADADAK